MDDVSLGDRELDVMGVLWELGSGTVSEVREVLDDPLAYTTVLTVLRNLEAKGYVTHEEEGRAHRYRARVARQVARRSALARVIDSLFHGSPEALVAHLVRDGAISPAELQRLRRTVKEGSKRAASEASKDARLPSASGRPLRRQRER